MRIRRGNDMTHPLSCECERISPEDVAEIGFLLDKILSIVESRTYDLHITSDNVPQREETI